MTCNSCRNQIPNGATYCPSCGMRVQIEQPQQQYTPSNIANTQPVYEQPAPVYAPQPPYQPAKQMNRKPFIIIGALAVVAAVAILLFTILGGNVRHDSPVNVSEDFITAFSNQNVGKMMDCYHDDFLDKLIENGMYDSRSDMEENLESQLEYRFSQATNVKIEIKSIKAECIEPTDDEFDEWIEAAEEMVDLSKDDIERIEAFASVKAMLHVSAKVNGKNDEATNSIYVYCVKIESEWYVVHTTL